MHMMEVWPWSSWSLLAWSALTTFIWCSSPRAWTQWWNRALMLSWIRWTSSPSRLSNLDSRYSRFTWNMMEGRAAHIHLCRLDDAASNADTLSSKTTQRAFLSTLLQCSSLSTNLHKEQLIPEARVVFRWVFFLNNGSNHKKKDMDLFTWFFSSSTFYHRRLRCDTHRKNLIIHQHHLLL